MTCAVKACKSSSNSYPLHPKDAELVQDDIEVNPQLLINLMPRIDWPALSTTASEVWLNSLFIFQGRIFGQGEQAAWFSAHGWTTVGGYKAI